MSNIVTDKIIPDSGSANTLTIGGTGDSVVVLDSLNVNTLQDAGGNNIFVSNGSGTITSKNSGVSGGMNLISTQTPSSASSVSFTSGLDSTYDVYIFKFISIHPQTNSRQLSFQCSTDGGSNYNTTMTTTFFRAFNVEDGSGEGLTYQTAYDQAQGTGYQWLTRDTGNESDEACSGELHLFAPSSTTYVKHFYSRFQTNTADNQSVDSYVAGYLNTTSAVNAIDFKMYNSSTFSGTIKLYGISKS